MTPKEILALPAINLDYQQYTLYLPGSNDPLPLDKPIHARSAARHLRLSAMANTGGGFRMCPKKLEEEIAALIEARRLR